jgi:hypothetical protein
MQAPAAAVQDHGLHPVQGHIGDPGPVLGPGPNLRHLRHPVDIQGFPDEDQGPDLALVPHLLLLLSTVGEIAAVATIALESEIIKCQNIYFLYFRTHIRKF